jgi:predicted nucleotide-binding protein
MSRLEEQHQVLQRILAEVHQDLSDPAKLDLRRKLIDFMGNLPAGPEFTLLYDTANETASDLGRQITAAVIKRLGERTAELSYQVGILQSVTKNAEADAQALSLKKIQLVAAAVKDTADAINNARELIGQNRADEAGPLLQTALDRMMRLAHEITQ